MEMSPGGMIITGLALVLVVEGLLYALFPDAIRKMMALAITTPPEQLRLYGLSVAVIGALMI